MTSSLRSLFASASASRSVLAQPTVAARPFSTSLYRRLNQGPWSDPLPTRPLNTYLIVAEDHPSPNTLARRLEIRERHLEQAAAGKEVGRILLGGPILRRDFPELPDDEPYTSSISGSVFLVQAESIGEVEARLSRDEYVVGGIFDPLRTRIYPIIPTVAGLRPSATQSTSPEMPVNINNGETPATRLSRPRSQSAVFRSRAGHREVSQIDPQPARRAGPSLSELRKTPGHTIPTPVTLGSLRKSHTLPDGSSQA